MPQFRWSVYLDAVRAHPVPHSSGNKEHARNTSTSQKALIADLDENQGKFRSCGNLQVMHENCRTCAHYARTFFHLMIELSPQVIDSDRGIFT